VQDSGNIIRGLNDISDKFIGLDKEIMKHVMLLFAIAGASGEDIDKRLISLISKVSKMNKL